MEHNVSANHIECSRETAAWYQVILVAAMAALCSSCATAPQIADQAVTANLAVEQAANRNLLLNVLRAYKRRPMHFTAITQVHGPMGLGAPTLSFTLPLGRATADNFAFINPSFTPDLPSFDVAVLDGERFIRGITAPLKVETIKYFLNQGWPPELIFHLVIRAIELHEEPEKLSSSFRKYLDDGTRLVNNPQTRSFDQFQNEIRELVKCGFFLDTQSVSKQSEPAIDARHLTNLEHLVIARREGMKLTKADGTTYMLDKPAEEAIAFVRHEKCQSELVNSGYIVTREEHEKKVKETREAAEREKATAEKKGVKYEPRPAKKRQEATFYLRSPEAVIYYLGQLVRVQLDGTYDDSHDRKSAEIGVGVPDRKEVLFLVEKDGFSTSKPAVAVEYDGEKYAIPDTSNTRRHRSMSVLTLVTELLRLQKEAAEIPVTGTVRTIGR